MRRTVMPGYQGYREYQGYRSYGADRRPARHESDGSGARSLVRPRRRPAKKRPFGPVVFRGLTLAAAVFTAVLIGRVYRSGAGEPADTVATTGAAPVPTSSAPSGTAPPTTAQATLSPVRTDPALLAVVQRLVDEHNGETAIHVRHLRTGAVAGYHEHDVYPSASLAKVPVLVEVYRQLDARALLPNEMLTVTPDAITDGAGVLQARVGEQVPVSELLRLAVTVSDNVAARLLLRRVGGTAAVNRTMASLGLRHTQLFTDDRPNVTTAAEMATLMAWVATQGSASAPSAPAPNSLAALLNLPQAQAWIRERLPQAVPVAHKSGQLPSLRHEAAVVYAPRGPFVLVGLTKDLADQEDAEAFLARLGAEVGAFFDREPAVARGTRVARGAPATQDPSTR